MPRFIVILSAIVGCTLTASLESSAPPSAASHGEDDPEGLASDRPPSNADADAAPADPTADTDSAATDPTTPTASDPTPTAEPDAVRLVITDDQVPKHARLDFSARTLGQPRARLRHAGIVYAPSSLAPLTDDGAGDWLLKEVRVLDADPAGHPRRPRVLCENEASRLGVAVDAQDLATTVRTNAFVSPRPTPPKRVTDRTPGVRLAGGSEVSVREPPSDGRTKVAYDGLLLVAEGFVADDVVDVVYTPGELADDSRRSGKLRQNVAFLDAPNGIEVAKTNRAPDISNEMHVLRLGPVDDGHLLVRYQEHESFVVGWVRSEDVEPYATKRWGSGGGGGGSGSGNAGKVVELARGTLLVPTNSTEVIGVVTKTHRAQCVLDCEAPHPQVRIRACSRTLTLRAVP